MIPFNSKETLQVKKRGFTLIELLIVIAIIAILAIIVIVIINPAETLQESRDTQRLSDLNTVKNSLGLYLATVHSPSLGSANACADQASKKIFISLDNSISAGTAFPGWTFGQVASTTESKIDGTGWIPVNFGNTRGGSPISNVPVDPTNTTDGTPTSNDLYYRYACNSNSASSNPNTFEMDAVLESGFYKSGCTISECNDLSLKDGGDNSSFLEVGTNLSLLPATGF